MSLGEKKSKLATAALLCGAALWSASTSSRAQTASLASGWEYEITPYLWASSLDGTTRIGTVQSRTSASFSDLLEHVDFGLMGTFEARRKRWGILADGIYIKLSSSDTTAIGELDSDVRQQMYSLAAAYRVTPGPVAVDLLGGFRYNKVKVELDSALGSRSNSGSFWDPVIGARVLIPLNERWTLVGHGDYGTRSGNSDWQLIGGVNYRFNDRFSGKFGYRHYHLDIEEDNFDYDMATSGFYAGLGIRF